ncbi:MAG: hypothetical protein ACJAZO_005355 [Myxococcota bacterium]|jgi:hypothetical protein
MAQSSTFNRKFVLAQRPPPRPGARIALDWVRRAPCTPGENDDLQWASCSKTHLSESTALPHSTSELAAVEVVAAPCDATDAERLRRS